MNCIKKFVQIFNKKLFIIISLTISVFTIFYKDFQVSLYEGELEQLFSYLFIKEFNRPFLSNHPGGIIYYITFLFFEVIQAETKSINFNIIALRLFYHFFAILILLYACSLYKKYINKDILSNVLLFYLTFPLINIWFYNTYYYLIIFSLGFLNLVLIEVYLKNKISIKIIVLSLGLMLSIYIGSITLVFYFLFINYFYNSKKFTFISYFVILLMIFIIYIIFTITIFPDNLQPIQIVITKIIYLIENFFLFAFFLLIGFLILIFYLNKKSIKKNTFNLFFFSLMLTFPFLFKIIPSFTINNFNGEYYFSSLIAFRLIFPVLGILFFLDIKISDLMQKLTFVFFVIISTLNFNYFSGFVESDLDIFLKKNEKLFKKNNLFFFPNARFNSEHRFLAWGQYRYGNLLVKPPDKWLENKLTYFSTIQIREYIKYDLEKNNKKNEKIKLNVFKENNISYLNRLKHSIFIFPFDLINQSIDFAKRYYFIFFPKSYSLIIEQPKNFCNTQNFNFKKNFFLFEKNIDDKHYLDELLIMINKCKFTKLDKINISKNLIIGSFNVLK